MAKTIIMTRGLPGSGKSTWAQDQVKKHPGQYKIIANDDLRNMMDNGRYSRQNEKFMLSCRDNLIALALDEGFIPIVDATHLNPIHINHIQGLWSEQGVEITTQDFTDVPIEVCIERDLHRMHSVGEKVIRQHYNKWLRTDAISPPHVADAPHAIICDLDGTVALLNGRDPYDGSRCAEDFINPPVQAIVKSWWNTHPEGLVLFVSGREDKYIDLTYGWLKIHFPFVSSDFLWMRKTGDFRKDSIIKQEIYEEKIQGKYNVDFVLDDRDQVVAMWREQGLACLQVAEGDF
jgi:predicted kinase